MWKAPRNYRIGESPGRKKPLVYGLLFVLAVALFSFSLKSLFSDIEERVTPVSPATERTQANRDTLVVQKTPSEEPSASIAPKKKALMGHPWEGPVLYYSGRNPVHFILVEKKTQKLFVYRYDGHYKLLASYPCATGENSGGKRVEGDRRTPEGIYFSVEVYRDSKVTIFGDRAFQLNYPDVFDNLVGREGSGIYIHGSNKDVSPFSTKGCVALENDYLHQLDGFIELRKTPVIIGDKLPYQFTAEKSGVGEIIPFLTKAMLPGNYAQDKVEFDPLAVFGFKDRMVALGEAVGKDEGESLGTSRLYLAKPGMSLAILLKREWSAKPVTVASLTKSIPGGAASGLTVDSRIISLVESWRKAWEEERISDYISHYHPSFTSGDKDLKAYKKYKMRLNRRYKKISVKVEDLKVKVGGDTAWAFFHQDYRSDALRASGYKLLTFKKSRGDWKITKETWFTKRPSQWP